MTATELVAEGWHSVEVCLPASNVPVEFARDERVHRQLPWFGRWDELPQEMNVTGLFWRPAR